MTTISSFAAAGDASKRRLSSAPDRSSAIAATSGKNGTNLRIETSLPDRAGYDSALGRPRSIPRIFRRRRHRTLLHVYVKGRGSGVGQWGDGFSCRLAFL